MEGSKIFITGASGQLGLALQAKYPTAQKADASELDITDEKAVNSRDWSDTQVIINAAAYTDVDGAETPEGEKLAWSVNDKAVGNLANVATENDLVLVHISTDYVFDGLQKIHTEDEPVKPLGVYGKTKAAGDLKAAKTLKHYIVRSSWVIGNGKNFARAILTAAEKNDELKVVADQFGRPTFTSELSRIIDYLLNTKAPYGTYNASNSGDMVNWADFARAILKEAGSKTRVVDTTAAEYFAGKISSERPKYSSFDLSKLESIGYIPKDWREDLKEYIKKELSQ
ncbi:MAG: NAD(P)-dependent oxidoreductase [Candidatus Saccharimonadales bacterium]